MLDDLIASDLIAKNPWLNASTKTDGETIKIKINTTVDDLYSKAINIPLNDTYNYLYNFKLGKCPFIKDKIYYLADGTPFYVTDDYITIGFNTYYFYEFGEPTFLSSLSENMKKTIATIYVAGLKITIKK
jgi:hypothetical protein